MPGPAVADCARSTVHPLRTASPNASRRGVAGEWGAEDSGTAVRAVWVLPIDGGKFRHARADARVLFLVTSISEFPPQTRRHERWRSDRHAPSFPPSSSLKTVEDTPNEFVSLTAAEAEALTAVEATRSPVIARALPAGADAFDACLVCRGAWHGPRLTIPQRTLPIVMGDLRVNERVCSADTSYSSQTLSELTLMGDPVARDIVLTQGHGRWGCARRETALRRRRR